MGQRQKARQLALQCLYAWETGELQDLSINNPVIQGSPLEETHRKFAAVLSKKVADNVDRIDKKIGARSKNWSIADMPIIDRNILRLAICELLFFPDIPAKVSINEAIVLAKRFSTEDSARFVNGVLDAVFQSDLKEEKSNINQNNK